jgi:hypothetical protein
VSGVLACCLLFQLGMSTQAQPVASTNCCPPFDPALWRDKEVVWRDKPFVHDEVTSFLHVPLNMGSKVTKAMKLIDAAHATPEHPLMLSDERSPWHAELYIDVTKPVPGADVQRLSGTFLTKVFEGPFSDAGQWMTQMKRYVADQGRTLEKLYFGYTTCPRCAKAYGKNYVVMFAKVADSM